MKDLCAEEGIGMSVVPKSRQDTVLVEIHALSPSDSPRIDGESNEHVQVLVESEATLPPIVVHHPTMKVIDGMHRLRAAKLRGEKKIAVNFYDGTETDAFVLAVKANLVHGLPLTLADRRAAAARIVETHPRWSNQAIASATGLSAKTVATLRSCSTQEIPELNTRIGRDGRVRPVSTATGRKLASELMEKNPDASLREIAKKAGISPATAGDVRRRLRNGRDPVPGAQNKTAASKNRQNGDEVPNRRKREAGRISREADKIAVLKTLLNDPALRLREAGRTLLRWLDNHTKDLDGWERLIADVPPHCTPTVARLARQNANSWYEFAERLEQGR